MAAKTRLTAEHARQLMGMKKEAFLKTRDVIREIADAQIKDASSAGRDSIDFEIPPTMMGRDRYNQRAMAKSLAEQFYQDGYDVTGNSKKLTIKWSLEPATKPEESEVPAPAPMTFPLPFTSRFQSIIPTKPSGKKNVVSVKMR